MSQNNENINFNSEPNNFGLPKGYFQNSSKSIFNKIEWIEEHKEFPFLSQLKKETGFVVPKTYFNESESKLELLDFPVLVSVSKKNVFKTPDNYFEDAEIIQFSKLMLEEENELNGLDTLKLISKQNNFKVNENYFVTAEEKITNVLLNENKSAKILGLFSPRIWYSAAAVLTITLGLWVYSQYFKVSELKDCGTLACVDKVDLLKTKNLENLDNDELYELVDTKKLEEKLENKINKETKSDKKDLDTSLKNVSTEELLDEI